MLRVALVGLLVSWAVSLTRLVRSRQIPASVTAGLGAAAGIGFAPRRRATRPARG